jgi:hypothetical protein
MANVRAPPDSGFNLKELKQAQADARNARDSEEMTKRKLAETEADLKRAKEEAGQATKKRNRQKNDAQTARESRAETENKFAAAEAALVAAEGREQACQSATKGDNASQCRPSWSTIGSLGPLIYS